MRVVQFTIPVASEHSVIVQEDNLPYFYDHLHRHTETQVTIILKGEGTLIAGNYMQTFKAGDIYLLGANQPHLFKSDPEYFEKGSKLEIHSLSFFFDPGGRFRSLLELPEMKTVGKFLAGTEYGLQYAGHDTDGMRDAMLRVKEERQGARLASFISLLQSMADSKEWKTLATLSPEYSFTDLEGLRMNDVYQFTMAHYSEHITLRQVADIAYLTPQAFCRYFKKHTRKTYVVFLSEIRVNEACKRILAGEFDSFSSVAYDTGFNSAVSFNRVFKKVTGQSPRQYLRHYQGKVQ